MKKYHVLVLSLVFEILFLFLGGCNEKEISGDEKLVRESEKIAELYRDIYEQGVKNKKLDETETIAAITKKLGENGYVATDMENHINMENYHEAENFLEETKGTLTVFQVMDNGGFVRQDFRSLDGKIKIRYSVLEWEEGEPVSDYVTEISPQTWVYTGEYLFYSYYQPSGYDGPSNDTAIRIKPLDDSLRELCKKYVEPIGYVDRNMFITDWSEDDYSNLDFYDIYEALYQMYYQKALSYDFGYEMESYEFEAKEFEPVFLNYFKLTPPVLQKKVIYHEDTYTYEYKPRGMEESSGPPCTPYPEVVSMKTEGDLVQMRINVVWAEENMEKAYVHELTVRETDNGKFQYVSNHVIEKNTEPIWYVKRESPL